MVITLNTGRALKNVPVYVSDTCFSTEKRDFARLEDLLSHYRRYVLFTDNRAQLYYLMQPFKHPGLTVYGDTAERYDQAHSKPMETIYEPVYR